MYNLFPGGGIFRQSLVRRQALQEVGGYNELFRYYHEEAELSLRLHAAGYQIAYVPSLHVVHFQDQDNRNWRRIQQLTSCNAILNCLMHYPAWLLPVAVRRVLMNLVKVTHQQGGFEIHSLIATPRCVKRKFLSPLLKGKPLSGARSRRLGD